MKKNYLKNLDKRVLSVILQIRRQADKAKCRAFIVGGTVRDILLKKKNLDLDIVVDGPAVPLARKWAKLRKCPVTVHKRFATATVKLNNGMHVDFATARKESYPHSGALPVVKKGTLSDDLFRRDFTINTMAIHINSDRFGGLVDEFNGMDDLKKKRVRILHEQSFVDDPTRILRAVRFAQRFNFGIEKQTLRLLKSALKKNFPSRVKPQRYFSEFKKILCEEDPRKCIMQLHRLGGLKFLGCNAKVSFHLLNTMGHNITHLQRKPYFKNNVQWWLIYFMALVDRESVKSVKNILRKFNCSRSDRNAILASKKATKNIEHLKVKKLRPSEIYRILKPLSRENIFYLRARTSIRIVNKRIDDFLRKYNRIELKINGHDLKRLGISRGERIGKVLDNILSKKIDGRIKGRGAELREAKRLQLSFN